VKGAVKEVDMTHLAVSPVPFGSAWHGWGHGRGGWWITTVILFSVLVLGAILLLLRSSGRWRARSRSLPSERESALEVLERRFAEGQLSVEDYQTRRRILDPDSDDD
jgi:uncharacterized membrane protein